jgi:CrcB protein
MTTLIERQSHPNLRLLLVVGFLGGYTTFSSFEWETLGLVRDGGRWLGLLNVAGSVLLGYAAVWLGSVVAGKADRRRKEGVNAFERIREESHDLS